MKLDWLNSQICESETDIPADKLEELSKKAEAWLRTGAAQITWSDWQLLDDTSRQALENAGNRVRYDLAVLIGMASTNPEAALAMQAKLDGGQAQAMRVMTRVAEKMVERLTSGVKS